jgi:hypothetical protein
VRRLEEITSELRSDKASKEALAMVASSVEKMQAEMDKRFDRIEALLLKGNHSGTR